MCWSKRTHHSILRGSSLEHAEDASLVRLCLSCCYCEQNATRSIVEQKIVTPAGLVFKHYLSVSILCNESRYRIMAKEDTSFDYDKCFETMMCIESPVRKLCWRWSQQAYTTQHPPASRIEQHNTKCHVTGIYDNGWAEQKWIG